MSDELIEAMETMAAAVGAHASIKDKFGSLRVEFPQLPDNDQQVRALYAFADLLEAESERTANPK